MVVMSLLLVSPEQDAVSLYFFFPAPSKWHREW